MHEMIDGMCVAAVLAVATQQIALDTWPFGRFLADAQGRQEGAIGRVNHGGPTLLLSTGLDALATTVLVMAPGTIAPYLMAGMLHLLAVGVVCVGAKVSSSRRLFMTALALTLPLVGTLIAALVMGTEGRGEIAQFFTAEKPSPRAITAEDVRRLTDRLPPCEALLSANRDERGATFAMLTRQADASAIRILRWAVSGPDPDLAVEAALALEDLSTQFERRVVDSREALRNDPGFDNALAAADSLAEAIQSGLVDPSLAPPLAFEARRCYQNAESFAPERTVEVALKQARLELAVLCPSQALAALNRASAAGGGGDLQALRAEVEIAARHTRGRLHLLQVGG
jgi:hypothetical protein